MYLYFIKQSRKNPPYRWQSTLQVTLQHNFFANVLHLKIMTEAFNNWKKETLNKYKQVLMLRIPDWNFDLFCIQIPHYLSLQNIKFLEQQWQQNCHVKILSKKEWFMNTFALFGLAILKTILTSTNPQIHQVNFFIGQIFQLPNGLFKKGFIYFSLLFHIIFCFNWNQEKQDQNKAVSILL